MRVIKLLALAFVLWAAPAHAAVLNFAQGTVNTGTSGSPATVVVNTLSFQPKCGLFEITGQSGAADAVGSMNARFGVGMAGANGVARSSAFISTDNVSPSSTGSGARDEVIALPNTSSGWDGYIVFTTWDSNGFTLTFPDAASAFAVSLRIHYTVIGGGDIDDCASVVVNTGTGTGNIDFSPLAFVPNTLVVSYQGWVADNLGSNGRSSIGFVDSAFNQVGCGLVSQHGVTTPNTASYCRTGDAFIHFSTTANSLVVRGAVTAWCDGTTCGGAPCCGFRVNRVTNTGTSTSFNVLAIKGGQSKVTNVTTLTNTSSDITTPAIGFTPVGVVAISSGKAASAAGTVDANGELYFGSAHGTGDSGQTTLGVMDEDKGGASNTEGAGVIDYGNIFASITTGDALKASMRLTSLADPSVFRMTVAEPTTGSFVGMLFIGANPGGGPSGGGRKALRGFGL